jgi:hypothetical protein
VTLFISNGVRTGVRPFTRLSYSVSRAAHSAALAPKNALGENGLMLAAQYLRKTTIRDGGISVLVERSRIKSRWRPADLDQMGKDASNLLGILNYDTAPERSEAAAAQSGAATVAEVDRIFDDSEIDIVTIATPPFALIEYVEKACKAEKHLVLEKPMARTIEDARGIQRMVKDSEVRGFMPFG